MTTALQKIKGEVEAALAHDGVKMMQDILTYMQQKAPATTDTATDTAAQNTPATALAIAV